MIFQNFVPCYQSAFTKSTETAAFTGNAPYESFSEIPFYKLPLYRIHYSVYRKYLVLLSRIAAALETRIQVSDV